MSENKLPFLHIEETENNTIHVEAQGSVNSFAILLANVFKEHPEVGLAAMLALEVMERSSKEQEEEKSKLN